jgi:hypothetical protein
MFFGRDMKFCWIAAPLIASRAFVVLSSTCCSHNSHAFGTRVAKWHYFIHLLPGSTPGGSGYLFVAGQWIAALIVARRVANNASSSCCSQLSHAHANKGIAQ